MAEFTESDRSRTSHWLSAGLIVAAAAVIVFLEPLQSTFLRVATVFDEEGVVSNPDWLARPLWTIAGIVLVYALLRVAFERLTGAWFESGIVGGGEQPGFGRIVLAATFIGIPLTLGVFAYAVTHPEFFAAHYSEDELFENLTAFLLLGGGLMLLVAAVRFPRRAMPFRLPFALALAGAGAATLLLGLEEISYGQRIFGWQTPETMAANNLQSETNLHNYWTHDVQAVILWAVGAALFLGTAASALLRRLWRHPWSVFLPHQAFLPGAAAILLLTSHAGFHEPVEQIVGAFAFLYALQAYLAVRLLGQRAASTGPGRGA